MIKKIIGHSIIGSWLLWHYDIILNCKIQDDLYWLAVIIVVGCYAALIEFIQPILKLGNRTAGGAMRTCIPLVPYAIYKLFVFLQ